MSLAHPWALGLLALAAPLVLAYLFRRSTEQRRVPSAILWRALRDEQPAAQRARARLRHRTSLALVLVALALAVVALVGPGAAGGHRYVVVLDASASMATRHGDGDRLGAAAAAVATLAARLRPGDELALVVTGAEPGVRVPPTSTHADVVAAARAVAAAGAAGDNGDDALALRLADGLCRSPARTTVVVISDGAGLTAPPTRCPVAHVAIGRAADNLGVSALAARPVDGLGTYDVHVAVASTSTAERAVEVTLRADGGVVDVVGLTVPPGGVAEDTVRVTIERGAVLVASIPGGDALARDDEARVALPDDAPVAVLLVTARPRSLLAEALRLHPRVRLTVAAPGALPPEPVHLVALEHEPGGPLPPAARVVGLGVAPAGAPLTLGPAAADRGVVRWDRDGPWFRFVDLRDLFVASARHVVGGRPIVDSGSGALGAAARWDDRELVVLGFTVDESDLALRAAFPNLIANLIDWAAPAGAVAPLAERALGAAESQVAPGALPGVAFAGPGRWSDTRWLLRLALGLAAALVLAEQLLLLRLAARSRPARAAGRSA
ncbi:MAG: VWA domain-containing protein [Myxococcales bacterium]|nr:VWA domain-containing protein [Myxococcales bacterium]